MLRALKIQISKVVVKRVQEPVIHDLHHILAVLLASLFAHLKPWSLEIASLYAEWRFFLSESYEWLKLPDCDRSTIRTVMLLS